jgi:hypothetical protein
MVCIFQQLQGKSSKFMYDLFYHQIVSYGKNSIVIKTVVTTKFIVTIIKIRNIVGTKFSIEHHFLL